MFPKTKINGAVPKISNIVEEQNNLSSKVQKIDLTENEKLNPNEITANMIDSNSFWTDEKDAQDPASIM